MNKQERQRAACRKWRLKNLEKERERARLYNKTRVRNYKKESEKMTEFRKTKQGWAKQMLIAIRSRSKLRELDFNLTEEDLIFPDICPVLGIPIFVGRGRGPRVNNNSPSVDRWDNSKGYTKGNVRVISMRANQLKSDASVAEIEAVLTYMKSNDLLQLQE